MSKIIRMLNVACLLLPIMMLSVFCLGQNSKSDWGDALADALVKWDTECSPKGCILMTDVLRGYSGLPTPPDPKDFREYIGIYVPVDRDTRKPAYFAFHVDPNADRSNGVFITFSKTTREGNSWKMTLDPEGATRLMFDGCDDNSCFVRVANSCIEEGKESHKMTLLDKFLNSDHLLVLYTKHGKAYRTMVILSSFKKEYQRVLTTELSAPTSK
jgi:hypothetical protein